jgi:predicted DNA-binding transcriptional regulator AlpA
MMASDVKVPRLLSIKEVEEQTGIRRWRLYELRKQGKGPPMLRIGKTFRVPEDALVQWIDEQTKPQHEEE